MCVANTVLTARVVPELKRQIPVLAMWIHESPTFHRYNAELAYSQIPADHVDQLLGVADFQVEALRQQFPGLPVTRFDCTFGGLPPQVPMTASLAEDAVKVCILAHSDPRKGCYRLDEMFALGTPARPVHVTLVGVTSVEAVEFISPSRVPSGVFIQATEGHLTRDGLMSVIAGSDICLTLSEDEVKPRGVLEFLALGRPVVASDIPAHRELRDEFPQMICTEAPLAYVWDFAAGKAVVEAGDAEAVAAGLIRYGWEAFVERARNLTGLADGSGNFTPM
jgi:glycosyltransferase involved in cell wall biosynthesis